MDQPKQSTNIQPSTPPKTQRTNRIIIPLFVVAIIAMLLASLGTYFVMSLQQNKQSQVSYEQKSSTPSSAQASNSQPESLGYYLQTINGHSSIDDKRAAYFSYQLSFPSKYYATTDEMVTDFRTQGGMAPPRLILTTDSQILPINKETWYDQIKKVEKSGKDCILVWSTSGFSSFGDWDNLTEDSYQVISEEKVKPGKHTFTKRVVKNKRTNLQGLQAFVQFPEGVSYYIETCNMNSEPEFNTILQTFDVRGNDI